MTRKDTLRQSHFNFRLRGARVLWSGWHSGRAAVPARWVLSRCDKTSPRPAGGLCGVVVREGYACPLVAPLCATSATVISRPPRLFLPAQAQDAMAEIQIGGAGRGSVGRGDLVEPSASAFHHPRIARANPTALLRTDPRGQPSSPISILFFPVVARRCFSLRVGA